jgi:hypothetical protein
VAKSVGDGWLSFGRWVAKLVARCWLRQLSGFESRHQSKIQNGRQKHRIGQHTLARQHNIQKILTQILTTVLRPPNHGVELGWALSREGYKATGHMLIENQNNEGVSEQCHGRDIFKTHPGPVKKKRKDGFVCFFSRRCNQFSSFCLLFHVPFVSDTLACMLKI